MSHAEELLQEAHADPANALRTGEKLLEELSSSQQAEEARILRAMSLAARHVNKLEDSIDYARRSASAGEKAGVEELEMRALLSLSGSLWIAGQRAESLDVIAQGVESASDLLLRARFVYQRGAVQAVVGDVKDAVGSFESVLPVFREAGDDSAVGQTLNQLGRLYTSLGRLSEAEEHLGQALVLALDREEYAAAHGIQHNLGLLAAYRGDIPAALEWLQKSDDLYMKTSGAGAPQHVARSEVLISVGLFEEALGGASRIAEYARAHSDQEHLANALAVGARAALLAGRAQDAANMAVEAVDLLSEAGETPGAAEARILNTEARFMLEGPSTALLAEAESAASTLSEEGLISASAQANFLCVRIARGLGMIKREREFLQRVAGLPTGPFEVRIQTAVARARLRLTEGDAGTALRSVRSGLKTVDRYQAALGATDLRIGIEKHAVELADIGLGLALESRKARRILEWLDRTRARSLRYQPVIPSGDDEVIGPLAQLRRVEAELRRPENRGDRELLRQRRRLQEKIAAADRVRRGTRAGGIKFSIDILVDSLGDRTLVEFGEHDGRLFAVVVRRRRARLMDLGDSAPVFDELRQLRFGMRRAARRGRPVPQGSIEALGRMLLGEMRFDDAVVVVPPPSLVATPWAALPGLRGRSLVISPSAETWWRARRSEPSGQAVLVAGGPDLEIAGPEVESVGALYANSTILPPGAGVEEVRHGLAGAKIAHIASHATFSVENPMFSSLRLGDGDLNIYDIERLDHPPGVVILSACDSGYSESRAGDELAGLTSALLSMGTRTIVASVGLVPDSPATSDLMVDFHKGLVAGLEPAAALAVAQQTAYQGPERFVSAASFVCVGA